MFNFSFQDTALSIFYTFLAISHHSEDFPHAIFEQLNRLCVLRGMSSQYCQRLDNDHNINMVLAVS